MTRLSKVLFAATLLAAPATVFADDPPADGTTPDGGGGAGVDASGGVAVGTGDGTATVDGSVSATVGVWPKSVIDRPLTVMKGKLGAEVDLAIARASITILGMTESSTSQGLRLGAAYGVTDKIHVGAQYAFTLNEFEIKGPLTAYGAIQLAHSDKLDVAAGVDLVVDLGATDAMGESTTELTLEAGLGVRYKVTPKIAVFTGSPFAPGPSGQHLKIGFAEGAAKTFDIPAGAGMQVTPELFAYLSTNFATILLSEVPMGGKRVMSIADVTPLSLGGWFNVNKNIDVTASLNLYDLQNAGDILSVFIGARYFN